VLGPEHMKHMGGQQMLHQPEPTMQRQSRLVHVIVWVWVWVGVWVWVWVWAWVWVWV